MSKKLIFLVMLVLLLAFVAVWAFAQNSPSIRWEYTSFNGPFEDRSIQRANELGKQGWELITNGGSFWIFKRRLP